jgi:hypothetical protein
VQFYAEEMDKKEIAAEALKVLNRSGYTKTNLEIIVKEGKVDFLNLKRYFKDTSEVAVFLFQECCRESDQASSKIDNEDSTLGNLLKITHLSYEIQVKYKFIFLDFYQIIHNVEEIKDRYFELLSLRKVQLIHLFQLLEKEGVLRGEIIPGQYSNLANQMTMLSDYWVTHNYLFFGKEEFKPGYYSKLIFSILLPYLTDKGVHQYKSAIGI